MEVKPFGVRVTIIEPGTYATDFGCPLSEKSAVGLDIYVSLKAQVFEGMKTIKDRDPRATSEAMFKVVDAEDPPLRLFLGSHNLPVVRAAFTERLATWEAWPLFQSRLRAPEADGSRLDNSRLLKRCRSCTVSPS